MCKDWTGLAGSEGSRQALGRFLFLTPFLINNSILTVPENNLHPIAFFGCVIPNGATK
jgi:hypothetical protein